MSLDAKSRNRSLVLRHMRDSTALTRAAPNVEPPVAVHVEPGEELVGWYQNPPPWEHEVIVFTTDAFICVDGVDVKRIAYADVVDYESPKKLPPQRSLTVHTRSGVHVVRIAGLHPVQPQDNFCLLQLVNALAKIAEAAGRN